MANSPSIRRGDIGGLAIASLVLLSLALVVLWRVGARENSRSTIVVYCAAGVRPPIAEILKKYEAGYGVHCSLQVGPSGGLETQARLSGRGELYIPAAVDPFLFRLKSDGLVDDIVLVAQQHLVLALAPDVESTPGSLAELKASDLRLGLCNEQAAAGLRLWETLLPSGDWEWISSRSVATLPTVTELAEAIRNGDKLHAGFIWRPTAAQFGLDFVELDELEGSVSAVGVGVLDSANDPHAAALVAAFLRDHGQSEFARRFYRVSERMPVGDTLGD